MNHNIDRQLAARQSLQTDRLLGIDFVALPDLSDDIIPHVQLAVHAIPAAQIVEPKPAMVARILSDSPADADSKSAALNELRQRHDASCPHCTVVTTHTQTVFGEGDPDAALMFIGEAPGEEEDHTGRPFVGRAGQKLDEIIKAMKFSREQVYIANVLKSRPPNNRTPLEHEVQACAPYLLEQIRIMQPKVIVALGNPAMKFLLKTDLGITKLRGQWNWYEDRETRIPVMPTFHPSYILRNYTPDTRQKVWSDMQLVMAKLQES